MKESPSHLQTDKPSMPFDEWYEELCILYAKSEKIDPSAAMRYIKVGVAYGWWKDGFTPYVTFRENYKTI